MCLWSITASVGPASKPDVLEEVQTGHCSEGRVLRDFCDGDYVQSHPVLKQDQTLHISFYYDELAVTNPLGSKRGKHKLGEFQYIYGGTCIPLSSFIHVRTFTGVFYWMLLNIHPAYRSTLHAIQLLAVAKSADMKRYGFDAILKPAIRDLRKLAKKVSLFQSYRELQ